MGGFMDLYNRINLKEEGIECSSDFLDSLQEKVRLLNLYYSFIKTSWPKCLGNNRLNPWQCSTHRVESNYCDGRQDISFTEKRYDLNYKIYGERQFYFDICPFHLNNYKTYAFYIDDLKNLYYCFGCGNSGSSFEFVMEIYNLNLLEATRVLGTILWLYTESEKDLFFQEQMKLLHAPNCLTPKEWAIVFHLTRQWNYDYLVEKADAKRKKLLERVDRYIAHQYQIGKLPVKYSDFEKHYLEHLLGVNFEVYPLEESMMNYLLSLNCVAEVSLQKMANRLCIEKKLLKQRIYEYEKRR